MEPVQRILLALDLAPGCRSVWEEACAVARLFEKCRTGRAIGFADNQAFVGVLSTMLLDAQFVRGETVG